MGKKLLMTTWLVNGIVIRSFPTDGFSVFSFYYMTVSPNNSLGLDVFKPKKALGEKYHDDLVKFFVFFWFSATIYCKIFPLDLK